MNDQTAGVVDQDAEQLKALGYESHFDRTMSKWENFSLGFTYLSPVVGVYTIFASAFVAMAGASQLAGNYNTFLTLLTTQLQNQDPLDPLDTNQFTQQLVEFSSVEQQVNMNTNLQTLISLQQTAEATSAMQFLGSNGTLTGTTAALAANSPATWSLNSVSPATGTVTVTSSTGQTGPE